MKSTYLTDAIVFNLQLFADGGGEGGAPAAESAPSATEQQGVESATPAPQEEAPDLDAEFEELIKGKYKDQYGKRVKGAIDNRFKAQNAELERLKNLTKEAASAYGIKSAEDVDAISAKMREQAESALEDRAYQAGRSKEDQRLIEEYQRKDAEREERERQEARRQVQLDWEKQGEELKKTFPAFDFQSEVMTNQRFGELLSRGMTVKEAYRATHEELELNAMKYAAEQAAQSVAASVRANGARPIENGASAGTAANASTHVDPSTFDRDKINYYIEKSRRGEKVTFS